MLATAEAAGRMRAYRFPADRRVASLRRGEPSENEGRLSLFEGARYRFQGSDSSTDRSPALVARLRGELDLELTLTCLLRHTYLLVPLYHWPWGCRAILPPCPARPRMGDVS
jgi:hypothetical protein